MQSSNKKFLYGAIAVVIAVFAFWLFTGKNNDDKASQVLNAAQSAEEKNTVTITDKQASLVKVETVKSHAFNVQRSAVGVIDFNQERTVQVFSPYQGRITQVFVKAGDDVSKGQPLYALDSPDLLAAVSTLISTAGIKTLTARALDR